MGEPTLTLALTADERNRSRYRYKIFAEITDTEAEDDSRQADPSSESMLDIYLDLPRGTILQDGDCLGHDDHGQVLKIVSKPEPVLTVQPGTSEQPTVQLLRAAYHLGNRHVTLEVGRDYLRLAPDPVLEAMLHQLGVVVTAEIAPFQPEAGAYGHHH